MWKLNRKLLSSLQVISCKEHKQEEAKGVKLQNLNKQQLGESKVSHFYFMIHVVFITCSRAKPWERPQSHQDVDIRSFCALKDVTIEIE